MEPINDEKLIEKWKIIPFEPKTNDKFMVYMDKIPAYLIHKVIRPIASVVGGKYIYSDLVLYIYDPINTKAPQFAQESESKYAPSVSQIFTELERAGISEFDKINLVLLGPVGDIVESWIYENCKIKERKYEDLDWSIRKPVEIILRLSFENIIHEY